MAGALSANMIKAVRPAAAVTFTKFDIKLFLEVRIHFLPFSLTCDTRHAELNANYPFESTKTRSLVN